MIAASFLKIIRFILFAHLFIALSAVGLTYCTFLIFPSSFTFQFWYCLFVFSATLVIYNVHALMKMRDGNSERNRWAILNSGLLKGMIFIPLIICFLCITQLPLDFLYSLIIPGILAVSYVLPERFKRLSIRQVPFIKIIILTLVWTTLTAAIPVINNGTLNNGWQFILERFIFIIALAIPFDLRDYFYGKDEKINTLPWLIGPGNSKALSFVLLVVFTLFAFTYSVDNLFYIRVFTGLTAVALILFLKKERSEFYYMGAIDGVMFLHSLLFLLLI